MKVGKLIVGLVSGAVAGAAAGLLFAPKKGSETRKEIADSTNDYVSGAKNKVDSVKNSLEHKLESLKAKKNAATANNKVEEAAYDTKADLHKAVS